MATIIDNGGTGYSETGSGWNTAGGEGYGGSIRYRSCIAGAADATANWNFTGLAAGVLRQVACTWTAASNHATDTPWAILDSDGTTVLVSGSTLNQQVLPVADFTSGGFNFQKMAQVTPTGTSLTFRIGDGPCSNTAKFIIADAAYLDFVPLAAPVLSNPTVGSSSVALAWTAAPGGAGFGSTPYQVQRAPDSSGVPGTFANLGSAQAGTTYTDSTPTPGTRYWYRVVATDTASATATSNSAWAIASTAPTGNVEWLYNASSIINAAPFDGTSTFQPSNLYDGTYASIFTSASPTAGWAGIDLGAGLAATLTRLWYSPETDAGTESRATSMPLEYADSPGGTWTATGITTPAAYPFRFAMNPLAVSPGTARRCWRLRKTTDYFSLSELRFEGTWPNNQIAWKPARVAFTPGAGRYSAGKPITLASPTTNATIYYETGYLATNGAWAGSSAFTAGVNVSNGGNVYRCSGARTSASSGGPTGTGSGIPDGSCSWDYAGPLIITPTTSSASYSSALSTPTIHPGSSWAIRAFAYQSGGVVQSGDITTAIFNAAEFVPDAGLNYFGSPSVNNCPQDWYADNGILLECHGGHVRWDVVASKYYWYGCYSSATDQRGIHCYSSTDLYNWHYEGMAVDRYTGSTTNQTRPHVQYNPSPISRANAYVMWIHEGFGSPDYAICATSSSPTGPFSYAGSPVHQQPVTSGPTSHNVSDCSLFVDPYSGKWYFVANTDEFANVTAWELDPTTDYTSFNGNSVAIHPPGATEAPILTYFNGYYLFICGGLAYNSIGSSGGVASYKAATTLAGLASASLASPFPASPTPSPVVNIAQPTCFLPVQGRNGVILVADRWIPGESTNDLYHARPVWWPIRPQDFVGGVLKLTTPTTWDLSTLPGIPASRRATARPPSAALPSPARPAHPARGRLGNPYGA